MAYDQIAADAIAENEKLRKIISECAAALPNGAAIAPECSIEFMAMLPEEIRACFARVTHHTSAGQAMIDFAKEAMDLKQALAANAYPAADGTADIDNHALPIIEVTLRDIARRAVEQTTGDTK